MTEYGINYRMCAMANTEIGRLGDLCPEIKGTNNDILLHSGQGFSACPKEGKYITILDEGGTYKIKCGGCEDRKQGFSGEIKPPK